MPSRYLQFDLNSFIINKLFKISAYVPSNYAYGNTGTYYTYYSKLFGATMIKNEGEYQLSFLFPMAPQYIDSTTLNS